MKILLSRRWQITLSCMLLATPVSLLAQSLNLLLLPDSLKKGAGAVIQEREFVLEIRSPGKAIQHEHVIYTILNESGDYLAHYTSYYDKFNTINSITGTLYDATGREVKRVKKKDMEDRPVVDGFSMMNDGRYKDFDFFYRVYPYTVDYEEEDDFSGILYFEPWSPLRAPWVSTVHSKYVIIAPKDYQIRYKPVNCAYRPVITTSGDKKVYTWEARDLAARYTEVDHQLALLDARLAVITDPVVHARVVAAARHDLEALVAATHDRRERALLRARIAGLSS